MVLNKKAVVFTLIAILITGLLFLLYAIEYSPKEDAMLPVVTNRIRILDRYNENFLKYTLEAIDVSSFKAMNGMAAFADTNGFFSAFEPAFVECVLLGTLNVGADICPDMENGTLPYWLNQTINLSQEKLGINVTYEILGLTVNQPLPFEVQVEISLHYEINDLFAKVNRTTTLKRLVRIEGLPDPLYLVSGTYNSTIQATSTRDNEWSSTTLLRMGQNHTYRFHTDAPSFLYRFVGNISNSSCCGIESMIDPDQSIGVFQNKSFVDYLFWNDTQMCGGIPPPTVYTIDDPSFSPKFRLEPRHLAAYNISSDKWIGGC